MPKEHANTSRKLSSAEAKRQQHFVEYCNTLLSQGYKQKTITMSISEANKLAFVLGTPIIVMLAIPFFLVNQSDFFSTSFVEILLLFVLVLVLVVVHELIHGITWACFAKKHFKAISFGVMKQYFTPYCTCNEALARSQYLIGALAPTIVLGILPCIVAITIGSAPLFTLGAIMILAGGGDLAICRKLLGYKQDGKTIYLDHPTECGFVAFTK